MQGVHLRMALFTRERLRPLNGFLRFNGEFVEAKCHFNYGSEFEVRVSGSRMVPRHYVAKRVPEKPNEKAAAWFAPGSGVSFSVWLATLPSLKLWASVRLS